jgi:hypothetical protein
LIKKHKDLLDALCWVKKDCTCSELVQAFLCKINSSVLVPNNNIIPMTANINVDDLLAVAAFQDKMLRLLLAIIKAIFFGLRHS